tara:strand:- start:250 stop:567 length:318 start_codon:yes stop_codon:yes gene_type:complete
LFWCGDRVIDETHKDDAVLFGKPVKEKKETKIFEVLPVNWLSIEIFLTVQTQWRISHGVIYGLDYNAIKWIFDLKKDKIKKPLELLADLQVIEGKIIETFNKDYK